MPARFQVPLWKVLLIVSVYCALLGVCRTNERTLIIAGLIATLIALAIIYHGNAATTPVTSGLIFGLAGNVGAVLADTCVFVQPPGSTVRPMLLPGFLVAVVSVTALVVFPAAQRALRRPGEGIAGVVAMILALSPLFVGLAALRLVLEVFKYELES